MNPQDIKAVFGMTPEAAVAYLKQKGIAVSWDWQDMLDDAHTTAFTSAYLALNAYNAISFRRLGLGFFRLNSTTFGGVY